MSAIICLSYDLHKEFKFVYVTIMCQPYHYHYHGLFDMSCVCLNYQCWMKNITSIMILLVYIVLHLICGDNVSYNKAKMIVDLQVGFVIESQKVAL